jgi:hypothetical protein
MNSYVERTRPALSFVDIGIALRDYPNARRYCQLNPGNSNKGIVKAVWVGKLSPEQEKTVLKTIADGAA